MIPSAVASCTARIACALPSASRIWASFWPSAEGIKLINQAKPDEGVLTLKAYEALAQMANGQATKIIVPSDLQGVASLATTVKEIVSDKKAK